jgi:4,5-dihydroxyphthalate decarboxylase
VGADDLYKAFCKARDNSVARLMTAPWLASRSLGSANLRWTHGGRSVVIPGPYGVASNATTLDTFLAYAYEQGVCQRQLQPAELFAPQVDGGYKV